MIKARAMELLQLGIMFLLVREHGLLETYQSLMKLRLERDVLLQKMCRRATVVMPHPVVFLSKNNS